MGRFCLLMVAVLACHQAVISQDGLNVQIECLFWNAYDGAQDVAVQEDLICVADDYAGISLVTRSPCAEIGSLVMAGSAVGVDISGSYAYVACYDAGLRIVDITDPTAPIDR